MRGVIDYDAEIAKLRDKINRNQLQLRKWPQLREKKQDPEMERIAAERQAREQQQRDDLLRATIEQDFRMIEVLQRERDRQPPSRHPTQEGARGLGFTATVYRVLIASPSDVIDERRAIPDVIYSWNAVHAADLCTVLLPVMWETHSRPEMGDRPQAIINKQLVTGCDMLIGAFWTRIGSPTGVAESGTVEEIEQFLAAGKPIMLYFSTQPTVPDIIDPEQYKRLRDFKDKCRKAGLVEQYNSVTELRDKLYRHLLRLVRGLPKTAGDTSVAASETREQSPVVVREQFRALVRRYEPEWVAERDSKPGNIEEGKRILIRYGSAILDLMPLLDGKVGADIVDALQGIVNESREMQKRNIYADAGASYRDFWHSGDSMIQRLGNIVDRMQ